MAKTELYCVLMAANVAHHLGASAVRGIDQTGKILHLTRFGGFFIIPLVPS